MSKRFNNLSTGTVVLIMIFSIPLYLNNYVLPIDSNFSSFQSLLGDGQRLNNISVLILLTGSGSKAIHPKEQIDGSVEIHTEIIQSNREIEAFDCCQILNKYEKHGNNIFCFAIPEQWSTIDQWLLKVINKMSLTPMSEWDFLVSNGDHLTYVTNNGSIVIDKERSRRIFLGASFNSMQKLCRLFNTNDQRWEYLSVGDHGLILQNISFLMSNDPKLELDYLLQTSKYRKLKADQIANRIRQKYFDSKADELENSKGTTSKVCL